MGVKTTLFVLFILGSFGSLAQSTLLIRGYVREKSTDQPLVGVNVYASGARLGTTTDANGYYTLILPERPKLAAASLTPSDVMAQPQVGTGTTNLTFSLVGYAPLVLAVTDQTSLNAWLSAGQTLQEVVVKSSTALPRISDQANMSKISVPVDQLAKIPALLGEKDVLKVIQLMPGVQKGGEGSTNMYVRGGGPDQNLFILDEAVIYNPSHLFGFFSVFNGDVLRRVELTKGGFPAYYGGRLSSVIETTMKEGSRDRLHGQGSIGLIASRFTLDGPLAKGKASFLVSGRRSYYGMLSSLMPSIQKGSTIAKTYFYDLNTKLTVDLGERDKLSLSGYTGYDDFQNSRTQKNTIYRSALNWGNTAATLRWQHRFSDRITSTASAIYSRYQLQVTNQESVAYDSLSRAYQLQYISAIRDLSLKYELNISAGERNQLRLGVLSTYHRFTPGAVVQEVASNAQLGGTQVTNAVESGVYIDHNWQPSVHWRIQSGLRLSYYQHPDTRFIRPEPRFSAAYLLPHQWSIKASYARMNQYVHILSNTGLGLPTDLWVPTTSQVKPQQSEQIAAGLAKDIGSNTARPALTLTVEGYYKTMANIISFREGATFINPLSTDAGWEQNVTAGRGWAYGGEVLLQKQTGRLSGWLGYTLSWTKWQFNELNGGRVFYPRYDRRHNLSLVGIYELSKRLRLSATWTYGTGQALTLPLARYTVNLNNVVPAATIGTESTNNRLSKNQIVRDYGDRNSFRTEPYHRLDVSLQYQRKGRQYESVWEAGVYNAYNRQNPFYYAMESQKNPTTNVSTTVLRRYSLFPAVPSLSYAVKF